MDVLHYYFEDDLTYESNEQAENQTRLRKMLYDVLYDKDYIWGGSSTSTSSGQGFDFETDDGYVNNPESGQIPTPFNPASNDSSTVPDLNPPVRSKRYIPPTDMDADSPLPFGKILDPPMH